MSSPSNVQGMVVHFDTPGNSSGGLWPPGISLSGGRKPEQKRAKEDDEDDQIIYLLPLPYQSSWSRRSSYWRRWRRWRHAPTRFLVLKHWGITCRTKQNFLSPNNQLGCEQAYCPPPSPPSVFLCTTSSSSFNLTEATHDACPSTQLCILRSNDQIEVGLFFIFSLLFLLAASSQVLFFVLW